MPRKSIKVCVRTRPTSNFAQDELFVDTSSNTIAVSPDTGAHEEIMGPNNQQSNFKFTFHHVLHNSAQETVYDSLARDVVQGVADGINGTIMSYGQTGSGKTFTMIGDTSNFQHRGIAPRALSHIFSEVAMRTETNFTVMCTYMEIYNERIFDLLAEVKGSERTREYTIAEDKGGRGVHVRGLTEVPVHSEQEALNLLFSGELGRTTAQHKLNRRSNRSHSIFTVYIAQRSKSGVSEKVINSKLSIVDLAGSERLKKTMENDAAGAPIDETLKKESMHINQSLTYLEQCVVALSRKNASAAHVPYRQTKLTNVLKDALGGNCNTLLCACIWGEAAHLEETISTLRLASRMMRVQNESLQIEVTDPVKLLKKQEQVIKELKQELLMHDALADRTGVLYDPYTPEQEMDLRKTLERFLNCNKEEEDDVLLGTFRSVRQMRETCKIFKDMYRQQEEQTQRLVTAASAMGTMGLGATEASGAGAQMPTNGRWGSMTDQPMVGEASNEGGFGVGVAPDNARPSSTVSGGDRGWATPTIQAGQGEGDTSPQAGGDGGDRRDSSPIKGRGGTKDIFNDTQGGGYMGASPEALADPNMAFVLYKSGPGKERNAEIGKLKVKIKNLKARSKACAASINDFKSTIDELQLKADMKKSSKMTAANSQRKFGGQNHLDGLEGDLDDVVDEEEFKVMKKQREAKKMYRAAYEDFASLKNDLEVHFNSSLFLSESYPPSSIFTS
jgi:kinesin family protein 6/9